MAWRFWRHKNQTTFSRIGAAEDSTFATISATANLSERIWARSLEERRSLLQILAILQCTLALLMPLVLHFSGVQALWLMLLPCGFALAFAVCAGGLLQARPLFILRGSSCHWGRALG